MLSYGEARAWQEGADGIGFDRDLTRLLVFRQGSHSLAIVGVDSGEVLAAFDVGFQPAVLSADFSPDLSRLLVVDQFDGVHVLETATGVEQLYVPAIAGIVNTSTSSTRQLSTMKPTTDRSPRLR